MRRVKLSGIPDRNSSLNLAKNTRLTINKKRLPSSGFCSSSELKTKIKINQNFELATELKKLKPHEDDGDTIHTKILWKSL